VVLELRSDASGYIRGRNPALAGIIGARRACTVSMISLLSMPCK